MDTAIIAFGGGLLTFWFYENTKEKRKRKKKIEKIKEIDKSNLPVTITVK